jgi:signal recognition particle receptor subunit beta
LRHPDLSGVPVLIFANKQDIPNAITPSELAAKLDLDSLQITPAGDSSLRKWHVQWCSAQEGKGLLEGLDWLNMQLFPYSDQ